jgi:hypothetical protein
MIIKVICNFSPFASSKANTFKDGCSLVDRIVQDFRTLIEEYSSSPSSNCVVWNMFYKNNEHLKMLYILTGTLKNVGLDHGNVYSKENH